ncbi:hypothetical protein HK096_010524, partial [Nowakowskiella sp. JEL0078]
LYFRKKRTWLLLGNMAQLTFFNIFLTIVIVSLSVYPNVWAINWIKLKAMIKSRWVEFATAALCIVATFGQFQFIFQDNSGPTDVLGHCLSNTFTVPELIHLSTDLFVRLILSLLFIVATFQQTSELKSLAASSYLMNRFKDILVGDFRATFVDTIALTVKLIMTLSGLPANQIKLILHAMDFAKAAGTHWFVMEISSKMKPQGSTFDTELQQ